MTPTRGMAVARIIERYLDEKNVVRLERDFKFLVKTVRDSYGELDLMLRTGRFTVYFQGNSLATVVFRPAGRYYVDVNKRFFDKAGLLGYAAHTDIGDYRRVETDAKGAHRLLQKAHVIRLMRAVRAVNAGEEITFEQILIADNPPLPEFLIIDRQVQDKHMQRRLDLLGLKRRPDGRYGFVVLEVKLGKNGELSERVAEQLETYVDHIRKEAAAYSECYEETYRQKRRLGLIGDHMPPSVEIDGTQVEGMVVVGGYTQLAKKQVGELKRNHPELEVRVFENRLF